MLEGRWIEVDDHRIHYVDAGDGFPLIMLHGGANDWHDWEENIEPLAQHYRVIAPDIAGFGKSDKSKGAYGIDDFVHYIKGLVQALGLERVHMAGHSLGGRIGLEFACHYPERISKLITVAPFGFGRLSTWGFVLGAFMYWARKLFLRKQPYPTLKLDYSKDGFKQFAEKLKRVEVSTMIIWGERDIYLPVNHAYLANGILANSRLEVMPNCGHVPQKTDSDLFNKLVLDFLAGDGTGQPTG